MNNMSLLTANHLNMLVCTYMHKCTEVMFLIFYYYDKCFCMKDRIEELSAPNK